MVFIEELSLRVAWAIVFIEELSLRVAWAIRADSLAI